MKNVEIKARCSDPDRVRTRLLDAGADFRGRDHQRDTYYHVPNGRLKLREGQIENNLIHYHRPDQAGPKRSDVSLCPTTVGSPLGAVLSKALGVRVVVEKEREIYFIDAVKFHIDTVEGLGAFVEIEAIDPDGTIAEADLLRQCRSYMTMLGITDEMLVDRSYSDLSADGRPSG